MPQHTQTSAQHIETLARAVSDRIQSAAPIRTSLHRSTSDDAASVARACLRLAIALVDGPERPEFGHEVELAAEQWARDGIAIDTIIDTLHDGVRIGMNLLAASGSRACEPGLGTATAAIRGAFADADVTQLALRVLNTMTTAITRAYVRQSTAAPGQPLAGQQTLASALLSGQDTTTARRYGVEIADEYFVLALAFSRAAPPAPGTDPRTLGRWPLTVIHAELVRRYQDAVLPALSIDGGTILLPTTHAGDGELESLIADLSTMATVSVTAIVACSVTDEVPATDILAHQLLDLTHRLGLPPGVYRFADLALEFQLTRPGPGMDSLSAVLAPLDAHPELLDTLRRHLRNNLNRQRTARALRLHTNTIDYRLKRVARLTGLDITRADDLWYLCSALVIHGARTQ